MRVPLRQHAVAAAFLLMTTGAFTLVPAFTGDVVMSATFRDNFRPFREGEPAWMSPPSWLEELALEVSPAQARFGAWASHLSQHDVFLSVYPAHLAAHRAIESGTWPLWDDRVMAGSPLAANTMIQPLSPFFWVSFLGSVWSGYMLMLFAQVFACALGFYAYFRYRGHTAPAAVVGALAITFSPYLLYFMPYGSAVGGFAFVPLVLYSIEQLFQPEQRRSALVLTALLSLGLAGQLVATNLQLASYQLLFEGLYAASLAILAARRGTLRKVSVGLGLVAFVVAMFLAAGQMLPTVELLEQSGRDPSKYAGFNSLHPALLLTAVAPTWLGAPASGQYAGGVLFFLPPSSALVLAFGAGVWFLALVGAIKRDTGRGLLLALLVGLPMWFVLARWSVLEGWLEGLPGFASAHALRVTTLSGIAAGLLVPRGFDVLYGSDASIGFRRIAVRVAAAMMLFAAVTVIAFLGFGGPIAHYALRLDTPFWPGLAVGLLVVVVLAALSQAQGSGKIAHSSIWACLVASLEIALLVNGRLDYVPQDDLYPQTELTQALEGLVRDRPGRFVGVTEPDTYPTFHGDNLPPNVASVYGLHDARGFVPVPTVYQEMGMALAENPEKPAHFPAAAHLTHLRSPWLSRLGVRYAASSQETPSAGYVRVHQGPPHVDENPSAWPVVSFMQCVDRIGDGGADELALAKRAINGSASGLLVGRDGADVLDRLGLSFPKCGGDASVPPALPYEQPRPGHLIIQAQGREPGLVRIAQSFLPGFEATLDGQPLPVLRADFGLQAVPVPHGGTLEVRYKPASWTAGRQLSLVGLLCLVGLLVSAWWRSRSPSPHRGAEQ
jgi:hypothetical protein